MMRFGRLELALSEDDADVQNPGLHDGATGHTNHGAAYGDSDDESLIDLDPDPEEVYRNYRPNEYTWFLTRYSWLILLGCIVVIIPCIIVSYKYHPPPDFGESGIKGYETRHTKLRKAGATASALYSHIKNLEDPVYSVKPNLTKTELDLNIDPLTGMGGLSFYKPSRNRRHADAAMYYDRLLGAHDAPTTQLRDARRLIRAKRTSEPNYMRDNDTMINEYYSSRSEEEDQLSLEVESGYSSRCGIGTKIDIESAIKIVLTAADGGNLFTAVHLRDICVALESFASDSCPGRSISLYTQLLSNAERCAEITDEGVSEAVHVLRGCAPHYWNGSLLESMTAAKASKAGIPGACVRGGYVYNILHYLTDSDFFNPNTTTPGVLSYTVAYLQQPPGRSDQKEKDKRFYHKYVEGQPLTFDSVKVVAVGLSHQQDVKYDLFGEYLMQDLRKWFVLAAFLIVILMLLYLRSFSLVIATLLNVILSLTFAYFLYFFVLQMKFFPFINTLAALIVIAVGADDVFIFYDTWQQTKEAEKGAPLVVITDKTFRHAALSIFVTSFTTAAAFFVNCISNITAICCFGIFAGTAVLSNFLFMVTWTPAFIVFTDQVWGYISRLFLDRTLDWIKNTWTLKMMPWMDRQMPSLNMIELWRSFSVKDISSYVFSRTMPAVISRAWGLWVGLFLSIGIGACVIVFVSPRIKLPSTKDFQVFPPSMPLENWELNMQEKFPAIKRYVEMQEDDLPIYFVWGFEPRDEGSKLDPEDTPEVLIEDPTFDFYSEESQMWFLHFCRDLLNQTWVPREFRQRYSCVLDSYGTLLDILCTKGFDFLKPCCSTREPPFDPEQLRVCAPALELLFYKRDKQELTHFLTGRELSILYNHGMLGMPVFNGQNKIVGLVVYLRTNYKISMSYENVDKQFNDVIGLFERHLAVAPPGMRTGFFSDKKWLMFYDLQRAIATGTYYSIMLSVGVAFLVMFATTLNFLITLYAIITIILAIAGIVASIVLMGWSLNIIESITISLAVGLSIDFTIHYGVAYRLSDGHDAKARVKEAFTRVGGAVAMAALTTFVAGAAVMPSRVLPYTKLGTFLMLCMTFSWTYATFFFQSICGIIGPRGSFCQIPMPRFLSRRRQTASQEGRVLHPLDDDDDFLVTF